MCPYIHTRVTRRKNNNNNVSNNRVKKEITKWRKTSINHVVKCPNGIKES